MANNEEMNPFTYKKEKNYVPKRFTKINDSLDLSNKEIKTLIIFGTLRIIDIILIYIYYNKNNIYQTLRIIDSIALITAFIFSVSVLSNKETIKVRGLMTCIFFDFVFICFDIASFFFYFISKGNTKIIFLSLIINEIMLGFTAVLMGRIMIKFIKIVKQRKKSGSSNFSNSAKLRKND